MKFRSTITTIIALFIMLTLSACDNAGRVDETAVIPDYSDLAVQEETLADEDIARVIGREIAWTRGAMAVELDVDVMDGVVSLNGEVPHLLAKDRIGYLAANVRGVRSVVNNLTVSPAQRTDEDILQDVQAALNQDPVTERWEVLPTVENGSVQLSGVVESMKESTFSENVVKRVKGVVEVNNDLVISYGEERSDADIEEDIRQAYLWDVHLDDGLLDVSVENGVVHLDGMVGSVAELNHAEMMAWVNGVESVETDAVDISWWARDEMLRPAWMAEQTDAEKQGAVERAFQLDPRVSSFEVNAVVADGEATLTGTVNNIKAKRAAAQDAGNTVGVWEVQNDIEVEPDRVFPDSTIAASISMALERDVLTSADEVRIDVDDGVVLLQGTVDSYFDRRHYEDVVASVVSVKSIVNELVVNAIAEGYYPPYLYDWNPITSPVYEHGVGATGMTDPELVEQIEDALYWSPYVNEDRVTVAVKGGIATLSGNVPTRYAARVAVEKAYQEGAVSVIDNLTVDVYPS